MNFIRKRNESLTKELKKKNEKKKKIRLAKFVRSKKTMQNDIYTVYKILCSTRSLGKFSKPICNCMATSVILNFEVLDYFMAFAGKQ